MTRIKRQLSKLSPLSIGIIVVFAAVMTYFLFLAFAATGPATLYTSPAGTQSATTGQSFAVNVRISTSANVPTVCAEVFMSYPTDKLQVTGEGYAGSPYTFEAQPAAVSGGTLHMVRCGAPGGTVPGGDQLYAQVTFKAIATGSAPISFTSSSVVTGDDNSNVLSARNGVTYNISNPATPPPSTPPPSSGGGSSSSGSTSSGSTASSGTSKPATGTRAASNPNATSGSTNPTGAATSDGTAASTAASDDAGAATTTDENGLVTSRSVSTVAITILDSKNKPVEGAEVTLNGQTAKTDKNGVARFESVPSGDQKVAVKYNGNKTSKVVHVKGASTTAAPELFNVAIVRNKFNPMILLAPLFVLLAAGVLFLRPWSRFATASAGGGTSMDAMDQIVTSDQEFTPTTPQTPASPSKEGPGMVVSPDQQSDTPAPAPPEPAPADSDSPASSAEPAEPEDSELEPASPTEEPTTVEPSPPSEETPAEPASDDEPPAPDTASTPPEASPPESQPPAEDETDEPPRQ